jgi:hypothetical protein
VPQPTAPPRYSKYRAGDLQFIFLLIFGVTTSCAEQRAGLQSIKVFTEFTNVSDFSAVFIFLGPIT